MRLMDRFRQMMIGRYGSDQLNLVLIIIYFVISVISTVARNHILFYIGYALFFVVLFRTFSRNINKRYAENQKFLQLWNPIKGKYYQVTRRMKERKTHRFYKCKNCGQVIRVPKGKGKIAITCPKCRSEFIKTT